MKFSQQVVDWDVGSLLRIDSGRGFTQDNTILGYYSYPLALAPIYLPAPLPFTIPASSPLSISSPPPIHYPYPLLAPIYPPPLLPFTIPTPSSPLSIFLPSSRSLYLPPTPLIILSISTSISVTFCLPSSPGCSLPPVYHPCHSPSFLPRLLPLPVCLPFSPNYSPLPPFWLLSLYLSLSSVTILPSPLYHSFSLLPTLILNLFIIYRSNLSSLTNLILT